MLGYVCYRDIIEPYMPDRVVRQLGRVQTIPFDITVPDKASRAPSRAPRYDCKHSATIAAKIWRIFPRAGQLGLQA